MEEASEDKKARQIGRVKLVNGSYQAQQFGLYPQSSNDLKYGSDVGSGKKRQMWEISRGGMDET